MKEFNAEEIQFETVTAICAVGQAQTLYRYPAYIGLDVHKETIAVAVSRANQSPSQGDHH